LEGYSRFSNKWKWDTNGTMIDMTPSITSLRSLNPSHNIRLDLNGNTIKVEE